MTIQLGSFCKRVRCPRLVRTSQPGPTPCWGGTHPSTERQGVLPEIKLLFTAEYLYFNIFCSIRLKCPLVKSCFSFVSLKSQPYKNKLNTFINLILQVAGLELEERLVICGAVGYRTHIKDIILIGHQDQVV